MAATEPIDRQALARCLQQANISHELMEELVGADLKAEAPRDVKSRVWVWSKRLREIREKFPYSWVIGVRERLGDDIK